MATVTEQIAAIEKEIRETPYHKATEHHIGKLRAKLSKLRAKEQDSFARKGGGGGGYAVKKHGDATVVLIGPPSAGKSTLLNRLTNAQSKVAPYAFTTLTVIPGMMDYKDARIQILDVPGLIEGAEEGKGRGREVLSVARGSDLVILMSDVGRPHVFKNIEEALYRNGIRLNQKFPDVTIEKKVSGGVIVHSNIRQTLGKDTVKEVAAELGVKNAEITIREKLTIDRLIDAFSPNRVYVPAFYVLNKVDEGAVPLRSGGDLLHISAEKGTGLDELKDKIWNSLGFVRVYLVRPEDEPNYDNPIVMKHGQTLRDVARSIGSEFAEDKDRAKIWGEGSKFPGQEVSINTPVTEGMQVRFI